MDFVAALFVTTPQLPLKNLKLRFWVGDLDLPERSKRYTSKRVEEEVDKQNCPCGKAIESRTHIVAECELYQEERDVLEGEMRDLDKSGMKSFDALDSREKTIAILGDRWWPQTAKQDGDKICSCLLYTSPSPRDQRGSRMPSSA